MRILSIERWSVVTCGDGVLTCDTTGTDEGETTRGAVVVAGDDDGCVRGSGVAAGVTTFGDGDGCGGGLPVTVRGRVCPVAGVGVWACADTNARKISINDAVGLLFIIKFQFWQQGLGQRFRGRPSYDSRPGQSVVGGDRR
jgi:hypothetical protein